MVEEWYAKGLADAHHAARLRVVVVREIRGLDTVHGVHDAVGRVVVSVDAIIDAHELGRGHDVVNERKVRQRGDAKGVGKCAENGSSVCTNLERVAINLCVCVQVRVVADRVVCVYM